MRDVVVDELGRSLGSGHLQTPAGRRQPGTGCRAVPSAGPSARHGGEDVAGAVAAW